MNDHNACLRFRTQTAIRWLGTLALLATLAAGCVFVVPVPTAYHPEGSRRNLTEETAIRFAPGSATVDDVVLALGEPDEAAPDASRLTYRWERVYLHLIWGWATVQPFGPPLDSQSSALSAAWLVVRR